MRDTQSRARHKAPRAQRLGRVVAAAASIAMAATAGITALTAPQTAFAGQAPNNPTVCKTFDADPAYVVTAPHTSPVLPCELGGKTVTWSAYAWSRNAYGTPFATVTAYGYTSDDGGTTKTEVSIPVEVLPANVRYFVDSGTNGAETDEFKAVKEANASTLLNAVTDQASTGADAWGYVNTDGSVLTKGAGDSVDKFDTGLYTKGATIVYRLPLTAGKYSLNAGFAGWWSEGPTVTQGVYAADGTRLAQNSTTVTKSGKSSSATLDFELTSDATVEYRVAGTDASKTRLSWFTVVEQYEAPVTLVNYTMSYSKTPTDDQADAYTRIVNAMDAAVDRWNRWNAAHPDEAISLSVQASYNPGVPTAESGVGYNSAWGNNPFGWTGYGPTNSGPIRFGKNRGFMVEGTALHEIGHLMSTVAFTTACVNRQWAGAAASAKVKEFDGPDAVLHCDSMHIWPYGNNQATEWNNDAIGYDAHMDRVVEMFAAVHQDVVSPAPHFTKQTLAAGAQYSAYSQLIRLTGQPNQGNNIKVELVDGKLPAGLSLDPTDVDNSGKADSNDILMNVRITGRPTEAGTFTFTLRATNKNGSDGATYTLVVNPASASDLKLGEYGATTADDVTTLLPTSQKINGNTEVSDVTWNATSLADSAWQTVTVEGTGKVTRTDTGETFERPLSATVNVVPAGLTYYIDAGTGANGDATIASPSYDAAKSVASLKGVLLNETSDQVSADENTWGLASTDVTRRTNTSTDRNMTGWNATGNAISYRLPLKAGQYRLTAGTVRWMGTDRTEAQQVTYVDAAGDAQTVKGANVVLNGGNIYGQGNVEFTLDHDTTVTYTISKVSGGNPTLAWLAVVKTGEYVPPVVDVTGVKVVSTDPDGRTELTVGDAETGALQLLAIIEPGGADTSVTWASSNDDVAAVDVNGRVTAKSAGTVTITATSVADPTKSGSIELTVSPAEQPSPMQRTVTFDANGGTFAGSAATSTATVEDGKTVAEPADAPTREGYDFAGWATDAAGKNAYSFDAPVTADLMLYARWTAKPVPDITAPVISGADDVELEFGAAAFDPKAGVTASDDRDGDLTAAIKISGDAVDTQKSGVYQVVYTVTDAAGNTATATRTVTVKEQPTPQPPVDTDKADKTKLQAKVDAVNAEIADGTLKKADYTDTSWDNLSKTLKAAQDVLDDDSAKQDAVDDALDALTRARDGLVKQDAAGGNGGSTSGGSSSGGSTGGSTPGKRQTTITGVTAADAWFDGQSHAGFAGTATSDYKGEYEITYTGSGSTKYGPSKTAPTAAGTYRVTISVPSSNGTWQGSLALDFSIRSGSTTVGRFYAPAQGLQGLHMWTTSDEESAALAGSGWGSEGDGFTMDAHVGVPVYRLYDPAGNQHLWTTSTEERDHLLGEGWNDEGIAFYENPTAKIDVYRLYNPSTGEHLWTSAGVERDSLAASGQWTYEGVAFKALS